MALLIIFIVDDLENSQILTLILILVYFLFVKSSISFRSKGIAF